MMDIAKLRRHRKLGVQILTDFINATPETVDEIVKREHIWAHDLIPLVDPFGDGIAARFEPINVMHPHELSTVARGAPLDESSNMARFCHAARMYRLEEPFKQFPPVLPKGKGGNRRTYNDGPILEKVYAILKSSGTMSKAAAAREAMYLYPKLAKGRGHHENTVRRIVRQM